MIDDLPLRRFTWDRPASRYRGYAWETDRNDPALVLARGAEVIKGKGLDPALHRNFAYLEPTPEEILAFANRWGPLQARLDHSALSLWQNQIVAMRWAVTLSKAVERADWTAIRNSMESAGAVPLDVPSARDINAKIKAGGSLSDKELAQWAALHLTYLSARAISRLVPEWDAEKQKVVMVLPDLLEALWYQFAHSRTGSPKYRQCRECDQWFQVLRSDHKICSPTCKVKMSLRRKRQALKLHAKGRTAEYIAKKVGSEEDTVRGWIKNRIPSKEQQ
jgi:hypothetical protein